MFRSIILQVSLRWCDIDHVIIEAIFKSIRRRSIQEGLPNFKVNFRWQFYIRSRALEVQNPLPKFVHFGSGPSPLKNCSSALSHYKNLKSTIENDFFSLNCRVVWTEPNLQNLYVFGRENFSIFRELICMFWHAHMFFSHWWCFHFILFHFLFSFIVVDSIDKK